MRDFGCVLGCGSMMGAIHRPNLINTTDRLTPYKPEMPTPNPQAPHCTCKMTGMALTESSSRSRCDVMAYPRGASPNVVFISCSVFLCEGVCVWWSVRTVGRWSRAVRMRMHIYKSQRDARNGDLPMV